MKTISPEKSRVTARAMRHGNSKIAVLFAVLFGALLATGIMLYLQHKSKPASADQTTSLLSESTRTILGNLSAPVEIRFYALLDPASVSENDRSFAKRVDQLLTEYEREGAGKIIIARHLSSSDVAAANAATADGITSFNIEKGDACFFGIAVTQEKRRETLRRLAADWEQALEADITRAISGVNSASSVNSGPAFSTSSGADETKATASLKQALPNLAEVSLEDGRRQLREAALNEFKTATDEFAKQIREAQQRIAEAQASKSATEQQEAILKLQQLQAAQAEKIKEITARAQAQVETFEKLKRAQGTP